MSSQQQYALAIFASVVVSYLVFAGGLVYLCVVADPSKNAAAHYVTQTLPAQIWSATERRLGSKHARLLTIISDRALILLYCAVVFGAWSIVFFYVYPWIDYQNTQYNNTKGIRDGDDDTASVLLYIVPKYHKSIGYIVFMTCVWSWRLASTSSPGIITKRTMHRYDHYPYDNLLFANGQICKTRQIPKLARSKYDRLRYNQNIPRYDHFCGWVYNTIGEENYRWFLLFLLVHAGMCLYGTAVVGLLFRGEIYANRLHTVVFVDRYTGEEVPTDRWMILQYLMNKYLFEGGVFLLMSVMGIALTLFFFYHAYLTSYNLTTNESYKWNAVRKWYQRELKIYNEYIKRSNNKNEKKNNPSHQKHVSKGDSTEDHLGSTHAVMAEKGCHDNSVPAESTKEQAPTITSTSASGSAASRPIIINDDIDVTCTPSIAIGGAPQSIISSEQIPAPPSDTEDNNYPNGGNDNGEEESSEDNGPSNNTNGQTRPKAWTKKVPQHPGPEPRYIYDRGFVENWKEVLFPISLRKDRGASIVWCSLDPSNDEGKKTS